MSPLTGLLAAAQVLSMPISPQTVQRLLEVHGWGAAQRDVSLDRAAARLTAALAGPPDAPPPETPSAHLHHALALEGVSDVHVYPLTLRHRRMAEVEDRLPALLGRLDRRLPPTHFGLSTHGTSGGLTTTLLLVHRGVRFDSPLPRRAEPGAWVKIGGALRSGYFRPRVLVDPPRGQVRDRPAWTQQRRAEITVYFDAGPGVYGIELVAESQYGPVVLANHEVYVGVDPPPLPVVRLRPGPSSQDRAGALLELINGARRRAGVEQLVWHPVLARVAARYVAELSRRGTLAHRSPDSGDLVTRLNAEGGARFARAAEVLAYAATPQAALRAFMGSPAHKQNVLARDMRRVGVAAKGRYYVVDFGQCPGACGAP